MTNYNSDYDTDEELKLDMEHEEFLQIQKDLMERDELETDLRWNLQELWGKTLPDGFTLRRWERSNARMEDYFHQSTMHRETGKRGYGSIRVTPHDWKTLMTSATMYSKVYNVPAEPIFCCMAEWYL